MTEEIINQEGDEIRRPLRGRPPNASKLSNQVELSNGEDSQERASRVAEQIRAEREGRGDDGVDEFRAPPAPPGWTYQWKRKSVFGKEDFAHQNALMRNGWEPVPAARHPDFMPIGMKSANIEHKEMMLMACPTELVEDARRRDKQIADMQVNQKAGQLAPTPNTMLGDQRPETRPRLKRSYSPMPVPE